jgi:ABC-type multidrug transport system ATPase subunit
VAAPVIRCDALKKRFAHVIALDRLDLEVPPGQVVGFLGPNGAGKSTTIRILLDLARPDGGSVEVLGEDPRTGGPALRQRIGYLPGELRLDERLTVAQTLHSWARLRGGGVDRGFLDKLCERLSLDPSRETRGLSSGNRRKVGLIGAFMARPELLILDEPTGGLDPLVQAEFQTMVEEARSDGATVFLSSHVLSEVQRVATHVVVIRRGRAVIEGAAHPDYLTKPHHDFPADDIPVPQGTPVYAVTTGTILTVTPLSSDCGNGIVLAGADGYQYVYCHGSQRFVTTGQHVNIGQTIMLSGTTGNNTGPHLHFQVQTVLLERIANWIRFCAEYSVEQINLTTHDGWATAAVTVLEIRAGDVMQQLTAVGREEMAAAIASLVRRYGLREGLRKAGIARR